MEAYQNPKMLEKAHDYNWEESELTAWFNSAQYTALQIMRELGLENNDEAYNLAQNLWYNGSDEEDIREQLTKFATATASN